MKEYGPLMDCHVHIDEVRINDPQIASFFDKEVGTKRWESVSLKTHVEHIKKDDLEVVYAIYENPEILINLRKMVQACDVKGMYFVRNPKNPDLEFIRNLHKKDLIQGLKVHPVIDNFELTSENIKPVLSLAKEFSVPILYHSDDRSKYWRHTSPELQEALVKENSDIVFMVGHGGVYARPRLIGNNPSVIAYWEGNENTVSRRYLVTKALELTAVNDNAFYDLSVATNATKAAIIADFVNKHPGSEDKIVVGTDFPIGRSRAPSQLNVLSKAGMREPYVEKIAANRI
jgi:predicted TIM-barrel fold metal-dependent hydrolase